MLDRSRFIQKKHQIYPIRNRARADLPKPPKTVAALVPRVGSVGKHRGALAAKSLYVRNATVAGRQETLADAPRKFPLCSTNSRRAAQTIGLAVLIRSAGTVAQHIVGESWRSISRSHDGLEGPTQWVSYITAMTTPRPRTDWCRLIFSTSSRWRGVQTSS